MKILIISKFVSKPSWQGSAQHAQTFASLLINNDHQVKVISGESVSETKHIIQDGYEIIKVPLSTNMGKLKSFLSVSHLDEDFYELGLKIIRSFKPDVIHLGAFQQMSSFIYAGYDSKIPIVAMLHSFNWICLQKFLLFWNGQACSGPESIGKCVQCIKKQLSFKKKIIFSFLQLRPISYLLNVKITNFTLKQYDAPGQVKNSIIFLKKLLDKVDVFVAQTPLSYELVSRYGIDENKIKIINQWLTDDKLLKQKREKKYEKRVLKFGFIGNLHFYKGLHILSKAINEISKSEKAEFWILSSGANEKKIQKFMGPLKKIKSKITIFNDLQSNSQLQKMMAQLDFCIVPSVCVETGPRVVLEAIAQKVPCIVSDSIGNKHLIKNYKNGFIFKSGDYLSLGRIINKLIDNKNIKNKLVDELPYIDNKDDWFEKILLLHRNLIKDY